MFPFKFELLFPLPGETQALAPSSLWKQGSAATMLQPRISSRCFAAQVQGAAWRWQKGQTWGGVSYFHEVRVNHASSTYTGTAPHASTVRLGSQLVIAGHFPQGSIG